MTTETAENRIKRLKMRSWRRGTKEMDMILGPFSDHDLALLGADDLDVYERMLGENDHDLYGWFSGRLPTPARFKPLISKISTAIEFLPKF